MAVPCSGRASSCVPSGWTSDQRLERNVEYLEINEIKVVLTATTLIARGFLPDGTREDSSGRRGVGGGVNWKCRERVLKGGGKAMWRNANTIVRLRLDHVIVLEGGSRRLGKHGAVLGIDIIVFRVADNVAKGEVKERRVVGCRISHERVFRVENVLGEACRVSGFG
jgi:hypothetical protein